MIHKMQVMCNTRRLDNAGKGGYNDSTAGTEFAVNLGTKNALKRKILHTEPFDRVVAFVPETTETEPTRKFKADWRNENFRRSSLTWVSLFFLAIVYPLGTLLTTDDPIKMLESLDDTLRLILFVSTIVIQWFIFLLIFGTTFRENTGLAGLGFKRIRLVDFFWAFAFLAASNLILSGLALLLAELGMPMLGEIKFLIPQDTTGRIVWFFLSLTAGICEETAFRGYLMTRLRLIGGFQNWVLPTIISAVVFGACHAYQGIPGLIIISVYGALFSLMFIYTRTIWPVIIAHFFQDFMALFFPQ